MRTFIAITLVLLLSACANHQSDQLKAWSQIEQSRQARLDTLASSCTTDLCVVMVAQEANKGATPLPRQQAHPGWALLDRALGLAVPAYFGYRQSEAWANALVDVTQSVTSMERSYTYTDNSLQVGGDQIGGSRVDDYSTQIGRDAVGGNYTASSIGGDSVGQDQRHGDDIQLSDACVGDSCYSQSPGPVDNSNTSNAQAGLE